MSTFTGIGAALPRSLTVPAARPAADPTPPVPQSQPAVEPTARGKTIAEWLAFVERKPPAPTRHEYRLSGPRVAPSPRVRCAFDRPLHRNGPRRPVQSRFFMARSTPGVPQITGTSRLAPA